MMMNYLKARQETGINNRLKSSSHTVTSIESDFLIRIDFEFWNFAFFTGFDKSFWNYFLAITIWKRILVKWMFYILDGNWR